MLLNLFAVHHMPHCQTKQHIDVSTYTTACVQDMYSRNCLRHNYCVRYTGDYAVADDETVDAIVHECDYVDQTRH